MLLKDECTGELARNYGAVCCRYYSVHRNGTLMDVDTCQLHHLGRSFAVSGTS